MNPGTAARPTEKALGLFSRNLDLAQVALKVLLPLVLPSHLGDSYPSCWLVSIYLLERSIVHVAAISITER